MADLTLQEIERADRAKAVLDNPLVKESFDALERELIEGLAQTSIEDEKKREKIHTMLVYGRKWRNTFLGMIETGKLAAFQLEEKRRLKLWSK